MASEATGVFRFMNRSIRHSMQAADGGGAPGRVEPSAEVEDRSVKQLMGGGPFRR